MLLALLLLAYPRPDLLAEPTALPPAAVLLDCRPRAEYLAGHAPGARWVDAAEWARTFADGADPAGWSKRVAALGLTADSSVVVYDAVRTKDAARVWWLLRYWGVERARVLNGGWVGWTAAKLPTETAEPAVSPSRFVATPVADRLATKAETLAAVRDKLQIVDARSAAEHCGDDKLTNKRAGKMPGAKHLDWTDLLDAKTHRFLPPEELARRFAAAGIDPTAPTVTHCQGGGRAAVMAFALELMGGRRVRNYHASWAEWGNADDTPVVK